MKMTKTIVLGRRTTVLVGLVPAYLLIALATWHIPWQGNELLLAMPPWVQAAVWLIAGLIAAIAIIVDKNHRYWFAFTALFTAPMLVMASQIAAGIMFILNDHPPPNWKGLLLIIAFLFLLWVIAGWDEPETGKESHAHWSGRWGSANPGSGNYRLVSLFCRQSRKINNTSNSETNPH